MDYSDSPSMDYEQLFNYVIRFDELEGQLNKTWDSTTLVSQPLSVLQFLTNCTVRLRLSLQSQRYRMALA